MNPEKKTGKFLFLGTGTSQGVPVIGCSCSVCTSDNARDKRLRCSAHIRTPEIHFNIDIGPDFRQQCLKFGLQRMDHILITHEHIDHINGLDDIRPFNYLMGQVMPVYAEQRVLTELQKRYPYIFEPVEYYGLPKIDLRELQPYMNLVTNGPEVIPIRVMHGLLPILGFVIGDLVYITDAKTFPPESLPFLKNARTVILNALHHKEHHSHMNLDEVLRFISGQGLKKVYLTHLSHQMGSYDEVSKSLPEGVHLAYDGLELEFSY